MVTEKVILQDTSTYEKKGNIEKRKQFWYVLQINTFMSRVLPCLPELKGMAVLQVLRQGEKGLSPSENLSRFAQQLSFFFSVYTEAHEYTQLCAHTNTYAHIQLPPRNNVEQRFLNWKAEHRINLSLSHS